MKLFTTFLILGCLAAYGTASDFAGFDEGDDGALDESSLGTSFRFVALMNNLDEENCTQTPPFTLSDNSWKVRICRMYIPGKSENLDISLEADIRDKSVSVDARGVFNLRKSNNNPHDTLQRILEWTQFTANKPTHVINNFLMHTVYTDYISDGKLRFDIDITTKPMEKIDVEYETEYVSTKIRTVIKNVNLLSDTNHYVITPEVVLKGIKWSIVVEKFNHTLVAIIKADEDDLETDFQTRIIATIRLLPYTYNRIGQCPQPLKVDVNQAFHKGSSSYVVNLLPWASFTAGGSDYIIKNTSSLLVDLRVGSKERVSHFDF